MIDLLFIIPHKMFGFSSIRWFSISHGLRIRNFITFKDSIPQAIAGGSGHGGGGVTEGRERKTLSTFSSGIPADFFVFAFDSLLIKNFQVRWLFDIRYQ